MGKKQIFILVILCSLSAVAEDVVKDSSNTQAGIECPNCDKGVVSPGLVVSTSSIAQIRDKMKDPKFIKDITKILPEEDRSQVAREEIELLNEGRKQAGPSDQFEKTMSGAATDLSKTIQNLNKFETANGTKIIIKPKGVDIKYPFK